MLRYFVLVRFECVSCHVVRRRLKRRDRESVFIRIVFARGFLRRLLLPPISITRVLISPSRFHRTPDGPRPSPQRQPLGRHGEARVPGARVRTNHRFQERGVAFASRPLQFRDDKKKLVVVFFTRQTERPRGSRLFLAPELVRLDSQAHVFHITWVQGRSSRRCALASLRARHRAPENRNVYCAIFWYLIFWPAPNAPHFVRERSRVCSDGRFRGYRYRRGE